MKSKSNRRLLYTVYAHGALFLIGVLVMFIGLATDILYPGNADVPMAVFRAVAAQRINLSIMWLLLLMMHVVLVYGYYLYKKWQQSQHERFVYQDNPIQKQPDYTRLQDDTTQADEINEQQPGARYQQNKRRNIRQ